MKETNKSLDTAQAGIRYGNWSIEEMVIVAELVVKVIASSTHIT
jgi:hypothetical protein